MPQRLISHQALIVVDVQNDFCTNGALAVPQGEDIIPRINALTQKFAHVVLTQDWHPRHHISFASEHRQQPFTSITLPYGEQTLWPEHCIQGSWGADFHPLLDTTRASLILRKGYHQEIDSYSAFIESDRQTTTGLAAWLRAKSIQQLRICGLATDFCVYWSAIDAQAAGFTCWVDLAASRAIDINQSLTKAISDMQSKGIQLLDENAPCTELSSCAVDTAR